MDIVERFINYTKINTTTSRENGANGIMPSSLVKWNWQNCWQ